MDFTDLGVVLAPNSVLSNIIVSAPIQKNVHGNPHPAFNAAQGGVCTELIFKFHFEEQFTALGAQNYQNIKQKGPASTKLL